MPVGYTYMYCTEIIGWVAGTVSNDGQQYEQPYCRMTLPPQETQAPMVCEKTIYHCFPSSASRKLTLFFVRLYTCACDVNILL